MVSLPLPGHGKSIDLKVVLDGSHVENRNKCEMAVNLGYDVLVLDTNLPTTYKMNKSKCLDDIFLRAMFSVLFRQF